MKKEIKPIGIKHIKDIIEIIKNRKKAILKTLMNAKNNIVLILGKGIEEYQNIKNEKIPHSDIEIVKEYINAHRY